MVSTPIDQYLVAGKITGAYGIKGWVKIHAFLAEADDIKRFDVKCRRPGSQVLQSINIVALKPHGKGLVAQIDGCNDRNAAELLTACELLVDSEALPRLDEGDFYWRDLIGLEVTSEFEGKHYKLGCVDALFETGANDVLVVKSCQGSVDKRERLIPYLPDDVVLSIDVDTKQMLVDWDPEF